MTVAPGIQREPLALRKAWLVYQRLMNFLFLAAEIVAAGTLLLLVLLLTFSCIQGLLGWRAQTLWLIEIAEHSLLPLAFLGAALAVRTRGHQSVDLLSLLPGRLGDRWFEAFSWTVVAAFGTVFVCAGLYYVRANYLVGGTLASAPVPKWSFYLCYPASGVLMTLFAVEKLIAGWMGNNGGPGPQQTGEPARAKP